MQGGMLDYHLREGLGINSSCQGKSWAFVILWPDGQVTEQSYGGWYRREEARDPSVPHLSGENRNGMGGAFLPFSFLFAPLLFVCFKKISLSFFPGERNPLCQIQGYLMKAQLYIKGFWSHSSIFLLNNEGRCVSYVWAEHAKVEER